MHSSIQVINGAASGGSSSSGSGGSKAAAALSSTATAAAAGAWPTLPTWLFGFACGSATASAMAYNYLKPQPAAAADGGSWHSLARYSALAHGASSSSGSSQLLSSRLTDISFPGSDSSSHITQDSSSSSSWSNSLLGSMSAGLGYLQQLSRLGAASAHGERSAPGGQLAVLHFSFFLCKHRQHNIIGTRILVGPVHAVAEVAC